MKTKLLILSCLVFFLSGCKSSSVFSWHTLEGSDTALSMLTSADSQHLAVVFQSQDANGNSVRVLRQVAAVTGNPEWSVQFPVLEYGIEEKDTLLSPGAGNTGYLLLRSSTGHSELARYGVDGTLLQSEDFPGEYLTDSAPLAQDAGTRLLALRDGSSVSFVRWSSAGVQTLLQATGTSFDVYVTTGSNNTWYAVWLDNDTRDLHIRQLDTSGNVLYSRDLPNYSFINNVLGFGSNLAIDGTYQDPTLYTTNVRLLNTDTNSLQTLGSGDLLEADAAGPLLMQYSDVFNGEALNRYDFSGNTLWSIPTEREVKVFSQADGGILTLTSTYTVSAPDSLGFVTSTVQSRVGQYDANGQLVHDWLPKASSEKRLPCPTFYVCAELPVTKGYFISIATASADGNVFVGGGYGSTTTQGVVGLLDPAKAETSP